MSEITIEFRGICTHLIGDSLDPARPKFTMRDGGGRPVPHRVFIAHPNMCGQLRGRCVPPHTPKYQLGSIRPAEVLAEVLRIEGADDDAEIVYTPQFKQLPSVWAHTPGPVRPQPSPEALEPWTNRADLLFNFYGGTTFDADAGDNVIVTVRLRHGHHAKLIRTRPDGTSISSPLHPGEPIVITNIPDHELSCTDEDYLLHYVPTSADLGNLPDWRSKYLSPNELRQEKKAAYEGKKPNHEVYCSNSTYP